MATIDSDLARRGIERMISASTAVKGEVRRMFRQLEKNASYYEELDIVDPSVTEAFQSAVTLRKVRITAHKHDYRVIFAHWTDANHVDLLMAFPRKGRI